MTNRGAGQDAGQVLARRHQRLGERLHRDALGDRVERGKLRREDAVDQHEAQAIELQPGQTSLDRRRNGSATGQRTGLAQQRAQVGIAPGFEPAMRQALGLEAGEGVLAQLAHGRAARQLGLAVGVLLDELLFGSRLQRGDDGHQAASP